MKLDTVGLINLYQITSELLTLTPCMVARETCCGHTGGTRVAGPDRMDARAALLLREVRACNTSGVKGLLTSGVDANSRDDLSHDWQSALYLAICLNSQDIVFLLLHFGADVNAATSWGNRPIHAAADLGHEGILTLLLRHNDARGRVIEVNAKNKNGDTALHLAAARGHLRICKTLLSHKADPKALNNRGRTVRDEASSNGKSAVFQELYKHRRIDENSEGTNPSTAPIQRRHNVVSVGPLITEPVRAWKWSREREPVESEDTSIETSSSDASWSSDSVDGHFHSTSSDSINSSKSSSSSSSSITSSSSSSSKPSTSISVLLSRSISQSSRSSLDALPETFESETWQKKPLRTESVRMERSQSTVDSHCDTVDDKGVNVMETQPSVPSETPTKTSYDSYLEDVQLGLVDKDDQLKILKDQCESLVKKLAEKEKENTLLRGLLKKSLSQKIESHNSAA